MKEKKQEDKVHKYRNFHKAFPCYAIEVLEGKGTEESIAHIEYYIYDTRGEYLGIICTLRE